MEEIRSIAERDAPKLPYHNARHMCEVAESCRFYAAKYGLDTDKTTALTVAGLLHDIVTIPGCSDNEEESAKYAGKLLQQRGYPLYVIDTAPGLILATKMPQKPHGLLQEIICDSDLDNLGRYDFFLHGELVREELGVPYGKDWLTKQLGFLKSHEYFTQAANELRGRGKQQNIAELEKRIEEYKEPVFDVEDCR